MPAHDDDARPRKRWLDVCLTIAGSFQITAELSFPQMQPEQMENPPRLILSAQLERVATIGRSGQGTSEHSFPAATQHPTHTQKLGIGHLKQLVLPVRTSIPIVGDYVFEADYFPSVSFDVPLEGQNVVRTPTIDMQAHAPHAEGHWSEAPKLLWYPKHPCGVEVGEQEEAVTDPPQPLSFQDLQGCAIKRVRRSYKHIRLDALVAKYLERHSQLVGLHLVRQPCKFTVLVDSQDPCILCYVSVMVSMHTDCPAPRAPRADLLPKSLSGRVYVEMVILIIRDHREQRFDLFSNENLLDLLPHGPVHRGANIINSNQIFGAHAGLVAGCFDSGNTRA